MTKKFLRIENDQYEAATTVAPTVGRSVAQQVNHWVRVGRELEASAGVSQLAINEVLETSIGYDQLNALEQAIVRATWAERVAQARELAELTASQWDADDRPAPVSESAAAPAQDTMA